MMHIIPSASDMIEAAIPAHLAAAELGDPTALFELGMIFSTTDTDLVEAHKWFNLATLAGHDDASRCRAEVASDMSPREVAEAQRRAREWLRGSARRAA